jgi:hypothetical protein
MSFFQRIFSSFRPADFGHEKETPPPTDIVQVNRDKPPESQTMTPKVLGEKLFATALQSAKRDLEDHLPSLGYKPPKEGDPFGELLIMHLFIVKAALQHWRMGREVKRFGFHDLDLACERWLERQDLSEETIEQFSEIEEIRQGQYSEIYSLAMNEKISQAHEAMASNLNDVFGMIFGKRMDSTDPFDGMEAISFFMRAVMNLEPAILMALKNVKIECPDNYIVECWRKAFGDDDRVEISQEDLNINIRIKDKETF